MKMLKLHSSNASVTIGIAAAGCLLMNLTIGLLLGYSGILIPQIQTYKNLTVGEISLIATMSNGGQMASALGAGYLAGELGRKNALLLILVPNLAGWIMIGLSQSNVTVLIIGRFLQGFGSVSSIVQVYMAELATADWRASFSASGPMTVCIGTALVYSFGAVMNWQYVAFICGIITIITMVLLGLAMPESPVWLYLHNKKQEAEETLKSLRLKDDGKSKKIQWELDMLSKVQLEQASTQMSFGSVLKEFKYTSTYKPFLYLLAISFCCQLTGGLAILFLSVNLFQDHLGFEGNPYIPSILASLIRLVGTVVSIVAVRKCGKRVLNISSSVLMCLAALLLAFQAYFAETIQEEWPSINNHTLSSLTVVYIAVFIFAFGLGMGTIPWTLAGEMCPSKVQSVTSGLAIFSAYVAVFITVYFLDFMLTYLGTATTFWIFSSVCIFSAIFCYFFQPETNKRTWEDIAKLYK